ncbi:MAG: hypothetical protein LBV59_03145 [Sphingobacterium sp.]|jgi:hypothetical protein|uniref:hypothetical protein n=1 Tax=Sphingobacterium sp. TaxID=341027 RepID=UPI00283EDCB8|nr:hypothetical protein [Sphingobacterium sp.]MDR3006902.1 hypothetical protein [Sphingobacterium sp.]
MNKLLLIVATLLSFLACKKSEPLDANLYSEVQLNLVGENDENVLNSKLTIADLDLYYVTSSGDKVLQNHGNLDLPKNMEIIDSQQHKVLRLFANLDAKHNDYAETLLKVKGYEEVSIKIKVQRQKGSLGYSELFLNGTKVSADLLAKPVTVQLKK